MSSEAIVLASYNRHFPQAVSQGPSGIIAYGCRNIIYFIDARTYPPVILDSKCIYRAYKEKIAGLSFCKCANTELIASISDFGVVKIWDISTRTCVNNFVVSESACNVEWIHGSPNIVVFPQDTKTLIKWNFHTNIAAKIKLGSELKTCFIVSNEKCPHLLAVGHSNGTITVWDIIQEKLLHKFKDHSREINILTWSPALPDTLLSVCSDYSMRLWRMGEDKSIKSHWIGRPKPDDRKKIRILGICHPKYADIMICSSSYGDIGEITLSEEKPRFKAYSKRNADINCKSLFALFSSTLKTEQGSIDILYSFDSYLLSIWNITEKKLISFLPFFMGFVYDLSFSPVNPSYLSISNGDGIFRVWNGQAESQTTGMISVFVQAKTKIMTAAWHPTLENILVFGTDDGKLGIIDTIKKRPQYPFETFHGGKVYSVCWGPYKASPIEDAKSDEYFIYSCGGGEIYINRIKKLKEPALNFLEVATQPAEIESIEKTCSEMSWKSDYSCVCIGTYKGFIHVYNDKLVFLTRCNLEIKAIEGLRWHPESTYMSPNGSPLKLWLACCGNDTNIYILDTSKIFEEKSENSTDWIAKKLDGHKKHVNATCWSPHVDGYLVSASKDGCVLVWNACTGNIIASFSGHFDVVNTVQWSVFDEDVIYSGGYDNHVRLWKISQQSSLLPVGKVPARKKLKKPKLAKRLEESENESLLENTTIENENCSETNINDDKMIEVVGIENIDEDLPADIGKKKCICKSNLEIKKEQIYWVSSADKKKSLFGSYIQPVTKDEDLKDCMRLADILCERACGIDEIENFDPLKPPETFSDEDVLKFGFYTDQITALRMTDVQAEIYKSKMDTSRFCQLTIMANKVQTLLKEAADNGSLTSYLVSLAPSVSYSFWLEICEKYAIQLMQEQQPYVASTYFLMCNKIYEAIDVLAGKGKIVDALALAKSHLPESDPVITKLLFSSYKAFKDLKRPLEEVKGYLSLNEPLLAVKTLGSAHDADYDKVAVYICKKYNMNEEAEKYAFIFMQKCLMKCEWESFREFVQQYPNLQVYNILFAIHEAFYLHLCHLKKHNGIVWEELFSLHNLEETVKLWNGSTCINSDQSFLEYICDILTSKNLLPSDKRRLQTIIESLDTFSSKWSALKSSSEAHVEIALCITKFILLTAIGDSARATSNFFKIFESSYNIVFLPKVVFMLFFPVDLLWCQKSKKILCNSKIQNLQSKRDAVVTQYLHIVQCVSEKFAFNFHPLDLTIVSKGALQNNLQSVTEEIAAILSVKELSEFILAYFVSYFAHDLSKLVDKKVALLECRCKKLTSNPENNASENVLSDETVKKVPVDSDITNKNLENNESEVQQNEPSELKALIEAVLEEAEDKIRSFTEFQQTVSKNISDNSVEIEDRPILNSNKTFVNEEKFNLSIDSEKCANVSKNEICSSETESNGEDCIVQVASIDESSHAQCLASIDSFYHVVLFIMSNICKEEFSLLYYLKEREQFFNIARASHELNKFSARDKAHSNKSKLSSKVNENGSPGKNKEPKNMKDFFPIIKNKELVENTMIITKQTKADDDDKSELYNFTVETVNDNLFSVIDNEKSVEEQNITIDTKEVESLDNGDGKENSNVESTFELLTNEDLQSVHWAQNNEKHEPLCSVIESTKQEDSNDNELRAVISNDRNYSSPSNNFVSSEEALQSVNGISAENLESLCSIVESTNQSDSNKNELRAISNDHNYSCPSINFPSSEETVRSVNEISADSIQGLNEGLSKGLPELIHLLESKSKGMSYPSPLEIVPKVLQMLYGLRQKSACIFVREKLHTLIDEIVLWAGTFQVANVNFVCEICH